MRSTVENITRNGNRAAYLWLISVLLLCDQSSRNASLLAGPSPRIVGDGIASGNSVLLPPPPPIQIPAYNPENSRQISPAVEQSLEAGRQSVNGMINGYTASVDKMNSVDQGVYDWQRHRWHQSSPKVAENTDGNTTAGDWDYSVPNDNSTTPQAESITEDPQFQKTVQEKAAALAKQEANARQAAAELRSIISDVTNVDANYDTANDNFKDAATIPLPTISGAEVWNALEAQKENITRLFANADPSDNTSPSASSDGPPPGTKADDVELYIKYAVAVLKIVAGDIKAVKEGAQAFVDRWNKIRVDKVEKDLSSPDVYDTNDPASSRP